MATSARPFAPTTGVGKVQVFSRCPSKSNRHTLKYVVPKSTARTFSPVGTERLLLGVVNTKRGHRCQSQSAINDALVAEAVESWPRPRFSQIQGFEKWRWTPHTNAFQLLPRLLSTLVALHWRA